MMPRLLPAAALSLMFLAAGCSESEQAPETESADQATAQPEPEMTTDDSQADAPQGDGDANPFFTESDLPYGMPPFDRIEDEHYQPALEEGMEQQIAEIREIAENPEPPTFDNTIVAMERSGELLDRVRPVFSNMSGAHTNDRIQEIQKEVSPKLSAHRDAILLNPKLFERVDTLYQERDELDLDAESRQLLERYHTDFVRAGARLSEEEKERLKEINTELAELGTEFSQKVLKEVNDSAVVVDSREELAGLSDSRIETAAEDAADRDLEEGKYVITLQNTTRQPPLTSLENRELRRRIHEASIARGSRGNEHDTREIVTRTVKLRAERAGMLAYDTHADYVLEDRTAKTVEAVNDMLSKVAPPAVANARQEAEDLQALVDETEEEPFELKAWDWLYYADKLRQQRYDFDESQLKPYFELNRVLEDGVFYFANKLYGLTFEERKELPVYQEDVRVFEVFDADGEPLGLFLADFYARASKRGGAWMNQYVSQSGLDDSKPVVGNHLNIPKPPKGEPTLMTFDETETMFHEFGHALHGLFSDVRYPRFAGTSVPRDFVEYPSQVHEMWATWPEVLENYAKHHETGEPIPRDLLDRVLEARKFNQGFDTTEYLAASIADQGWHQIGADQVLEADGVLAFEEQVLKDWGIHMDLVPPRYHTPYFSHIMGGYSAGYYSYIWSEVLDAESVKWFEENGGLTRENGDHFRKTLLSRGGSKPAMELFRDFAGKDPSIEPLLERRGLTVDDETGPSE